MMGVTNLLLFFFFLAAMGVAFRSCMVNYQAS